MRKSIICLIAILACLSFAAAATSFAGSDSGTGSGSVAEEVYETDEPVPEEVCQSVAGEVYAADMPVEEKVYQSVTEAVYGASYFSIIKNSNYNPVEVHHRLNSLQETSTSLIEQLNSLYSPWLSFKEAQTIDDDWEAIDNNSRLMLGDILVSEDFSQVGIYIKRGCVFCLSDHATVPLSEFKYFNNQLHMKP